MKRGLVAGLLLSRYPLMVLLSTREIFEMPFVCVSAGNLLYCASGVVCCVQNRNPLAEDISI